VSSQLTAKQHPTSLRTHDGRRAHAGVEGYPQVPRIATDARSVWPHEGTDVQNTGVVVGGVVMDGETAETLAGVVRLLRRGGQLAWVRAEVDGPRSPRQLVALGIDLAAEVARNLLPDGVDMTGPTPIGDDPVALLRSAEQLLRTITGVPAAGDAARLRVRVTDLVGEANTSAGG
jgi:hypothetical protein